MVSGILADEKQIKICKDVIKDIKHSRNSIFQQQ